MDNRSVPIVSAKLRAGDRELLGGKAWTVRLPAAHPEERPLRYEPS